MLEQIPACGTLMKNARAYHYDDYFCPPEVDDGLNIHRLIRDLGAEAERVPSETRRSMIAEVIAAAKGGEFDGTKDEAHAWEQTPEGREAMRELLGL